MHRRGVEDGGRSGGQCQTPGWRRGVSAGEVLAHGFRLESMDMSAYWGVSVTASWAAQRKRSSSTPRADHGDGAE